MTLPSLAPSEFTDFFLAVHGQEPFPWQLRLAERVCSEGWPASLDIPTGAGKTAAIDVAVFHLALEVDRGGSRRAPVRVCLVVDRRLVVDDTWNRARTLASKLATPEGSDVLRRVASRLALLAENPTRPLVVTRLRGGVPGDPDWIRTPAQPAVITSTVDQVGSRLLFRGYGVKDTMRPVHAGLLGVDTLFLLDEAHLSQPFVETLKAIDRFQGSPDFSARPVTPPARIVTLSATQDEPGEQLLGEDDHKHPLLGVRLAASKPAELRTVRASPNTDTLAQAIAERAWALSTAGGGKATVTAAVCNRVGRARRIFGILQSRAAAQRLEDSVILLTGRSRPLDRDRIIKEFLPRMAAQRAPVDPGIPLLVVATQTIEAGADLDFDALVTETAPLDSLRQRFGRLNRIGRAIETAAAIIADAGAVSAKAKPDPIYGKAVFCTWDLLQTSANHQGRGATARDVIDFGIHAAGAWIPSGSDLLPVLAPRESAPVLLAPFIDAWAATSPRPYADADPALFLHGSRASPADVSIIWRADLDTSDREDWLHRMMVCPPSSLEALSVPISEARRWLYRQGSGEVADIEAHATEAEDPDERPTDPRPALRWRGPDDSQTAVISPRQLKPGDVIIVPSAYGGCDAWGWDPASGTPVQDLGEEANRRHRGRDILRLSPAILEAHLRESQDGGDIEARVGRFRDMLNALANERSNDAISHIVDADLPEPWREWLQGPAPRLVRGPGGVPYALERRLQIPVDGGDACTEDDTSSAGLTPVLLSPHCGGVRGRAVAYASALGLEPEIVNDIGIAGLLHDFGKAHPDVKLWMYGGDELACALGECLAKSGRAVLPRRAREVAALPKGARHEVASLFLAETHQEFATASDPDLVRWLIGTHHGWGRPFFPPVEWPTPGDPFSVKIGDTWHASAPIPDFPSFTARWLELSVRLHQRYGPWRLAQFESILRLADHRESEAEKA